MVSDEEFIEYVKENGWIKPLDNLSLRELFKLQQDVGKAIQRCINRIDNNIN